MRSQPPPPGWAKDSLTDYLESAYRNRFATFANKKEWTRKLIQIDQCFITIAKDWLNPQDQLAPHFFLRAHVAFRAACEHSMAGQATDTYPLVRVMLECAAYAIYINRNPSLATVWLSRHDDDAGMRAVKLNFKIADMRATIAKSHQEAAKVFDELYQRAIDFGAHPNERLITSNLQISEADDRKFLMQSYLHGDGIALDMALKTCAQSGVCCLEIFQEIFPGRFEILGVRSALLALRRGL